MEVIHLASTVAYRSGFWTPRHRHEARLWFDRSVQPISFFKPINFAALRFEQLIGKSFDIVINATSSSVNDEKLPLPKGIFAKGALAYEMMYGKGVTPYLHFAREEGVAKTADGLGMLVEQAAEAFHLWRDVRPVTQPVYTKLRNMLAHESSAPPK